MKKALILCLSLLLVFAVVGCQKAEINNAGQYSVTILNDYPIKNQLKASYQAGDEVTVELDTVTEQYYVFCVNDMVCEPSKSDLSSTYFTFAMPDENVVIDIYTMCTDVIPEVPRSPIYQESLEDIVSASVTLLPPDITIELLSVSVDEFVTLIHDIRFYEKDESWQPAPGQVITFVAVKADGSDVEIRVYDSVVVVDGVAYKCNAESCEALRSFANRILVDFDYEGSSNDDYPSEGKYELETDEQEQIRLILLRKDGMWLGMPECEWSWAFEVKDSDGTKLDLHLCRCHTIIDMTNRRSVTLFDNEYQQILDILSNHKEPSGHGPVIRLMYCADNKVIKELTEDENHILMDILKSDGWKSGEIDCDYKYIFDFTGGLYYSPKNGILYEVDGGKYLTLNAEQFSQMESILSIANP